MVSVFLGHVHVPPAVEEEPKPENLWSQKCVEQLFRAFLIFVGVIILETLIDANCWSMLFMVYTECCV